MSGLAGKIALVSGGASGIGRAIVERFVAEGGRVSIADLDEAKGRALANEIGEAALFIRLDVTNGNDWSAAIDTTQRRWGALTTLVNSAGISIAGSIADAREKDWRRTLDVNGVGVFLGCQAAVNAMRTGGGSIVNIASVRGQRPSSGQIAYCASKALVLNLTESVALYCGEQNLAIRCNAICPGVIETPMIGPTLAALGDDARERLTRLQLVRRLGAPEEIAAAALFLASDEASFVTGAALNVDGGFRIRDT